MKKFKSILGGILSLTMLFTLCTPVYASEETLQPEQQEGTDNTDLDYYKQFIPEGATIVGDVEIVLLDNKLILFYPLWR